MLFRLNLDFYHFEGPSTHDNRITFDFLFEYSERFNLMNKFRPGHIRMSKVIYTLKL